MLREELLHPLSVHFPVSVLLVAVFILLLASLWRNAGVQARLIFCWRLLLLIGACSAWLAVYTGNKAEEVVNKTLCDPSATHFHGDLATYVAWIFSAVVLLEILQYFSAGRAALCLQIIKILLAITGAAVLVYTAHMGAALVYQQGAAVYHPSEACTEFE